MLHPQNEIQRDKELREASILNRMEVIREKSTVRMLKLHERLWVAVAFQKLRENRKQVRGDMESVREVPCCLSAPIAPRVSHLRKG